MDPRYPVGKFQRPKEITAQDRQRFITEIADAPANLRAAVSGLTEEQLDTPYRDGGWTVRQVVHHLPDSHANAYIRFKLALTESEPTIKPYDEKLWAELMDSKAPIYASLQLLESLHCRWVAVLNSMKPEDFARTFRHPEYGVVSLDRNLAMYAWHSRHHVAHIMELRKAKGW